MQGEYIRQLLAGIALFLFALDIIEDVAKASGDLIRRKIQGLTNKTWKAFLTGVGVINVLQSTHAVSLLLLALVGGGLIGLQGAIGVVLGMNVGAVLTEALIGLFGLGFSLKPYIMPMMAIGGLGAMFIKRRKGALMILFAIGLTFFGLELLKESVGFMREMIDVSMYVSLGWGRFVIIGLVAAVLVQSSSAITIIVMTAVLGGLIPFPSACAMLMGAYIGSATTAFAVAFSGTSAIKKQVALSHLLFNVITCLIFAVGFGGVTGLIENIRGFGSNEPWFAGLTRTSVNGLIVFFLIFKTVGGLIHMPFIRQFTWLIQKIIPDEKKATLGIDHIDVSLDVYTKFTVLQKDLQLFIRDIGLLVQKWVTDPDTYSETVYYEKKLVYDRLFRFMVVFPFGELGRKDKKEIVPLDALQEAMQALKIAKNANKSLVKIVQSGDIQTNTYRNQIIVYFDELYNLIQNGDFVAAKSKLSAMVARDEEQMEEIIDAGKEVNDDLAELFQIHDHIHGVCKTLLESRELYAQLNS